MNAAVATRPRFDLEWFLQQSPPSLASPTTPNLANSSGSSSSPSSSSISPPEVLVEVTLPTKKRKRSGKVIDTLRAETAAASTRASRTAPPLLSASSPAPVEKELLPMPSSPLEFARSWLRPLHLGATSTMSRIGLIEMKASLYWHLISLSAEQSRFVTIGARTIRDVLDRLAQSHSKASASYEKVIFASLAAIGARRTYHSSITGVPPPPPTASPDELVSLALGQRREAACAALVSRAIILAQDSKMVEERMDISMDMFNILRIAITAGASVGTRDQTRALLTGLLRGGHETRLADQMRRNGGSLPEGRKLAGRTNESDSILILDAYESIMTGRPLSFSDESLTEFGYHNDDGEDDMMVEDRSTICGVTFSSHNHVDESSQSLTHASRVRQIRALAKSRSEEPYLTSTVLETFDKMFEAVDRNLDELRGVDVMKRQSPHFLAVPLLTLSSLATDASRRARGNFSPEAQNLVDQAQMRYLVWLKFFVRLVSSLGRSSADDHTRAIFISKLDFLSGWVEIAVNGASQHRDGFGPLAPAEFSFAELAQLHDGLKLSTVVFASVSKREADLARALSVVELPEDFQRKTQTGPSFARTTPELELEAGELVQRALRELEDW